MYLEDVLRLIYLAAGVAGPFLPLAFVVYLAIWLRRVRLQRGYGWIWCLVTALFVSWSAYAVWDLGMLVLPFGIDPVDIGLMFPTWACTLGTAPVLTFVMFFFLPRVNARPNNAPFSILPFRTGLITVFLGVLIFTLIRISFVRLMLYLGGFPTNFLGHPVQ